MNIVEYLIGVKNLNEGLTTRKDLILELRVRSDVASLVLKGLRELGVVKRKKKNRSNEVTYSIDLSRYKDLENHYNFLIKTLGFAA